MPTVRVKPSSEARFQTWTASCGFLTALPSTALMLISNSANSASHFSLGSSRRRLFMETASGSTLSMLICMWSRPASFRRSMTSRESRYPFVIMVGKRPRDRAWATSSGSSGCRSGSPPLKVRMARPRPARWSMRAFMTSAGTGCDTSSYSLQ
jgi:hypothetical protein